MIPLGVTNTPGPAAEKRDGRKLAVWSQSVDPHVLLSGVTGGGKTSTVRYLCRALLAGGFRLACLDGKSSGVFLPLRGRDGIVGVADTRRQWTRLTQVVEHQRAEFNQQLVAYRAGKTDTPPQPVHIAIVVDELVDIADACGNDVIGPLSRIARMGREAGVVIVASVLRPDVADSIPSLVRDQLTARLLLGHPSQQAARMMFGDQAKRARQVSQQTSTPGRGVALLGSRPYLVQVPFQPDPAAGGKAAGWLPPHATEPASLDLEEQAISRARELRRAGHTYPDVAAALTSEGHRISEDEIRHGLARQQPT